MLFHRVTDADIPDAAIPGIVGISEVACRLRARISELLATRVPVLLWGESGVGLQRVARALSDLKDPERSMLRFKPSSVPPDAVEPLLFGRLGASSESAPEPGLLERVDASAIYIEDMIELPRGAQVTLTELATQGALNSPSGHPSTVYDVRVLVSTRQDPALSLEREVVHPPLLRALAPGMVVVPPLRARREDVPSLALSFAAALLGSNPRFTAGALSAMMRYAWPGNVRELKEAIQRLVAENVDPTMLDMVPSVLKSMAPATDPTEPMSNVTAEDEAYSEADPAALALTDLDVSQSPVFVTPARLEGALRDAAGVVDEAARILGKHPAEIAVMVRDLGIDPTDYR